MDLQRQFIVRGDCYHPAFLSIQCVLLANQFPCSICFFKSCMYSKQIFTVQITSRRQRFFCILAGPLVSIHIYISLITKQNVNNAGSLYTVRLSDAEKWKMKAKKIFFLNFDYSFPNLCASKAFSVAKLFWFMLSVCQSFVITSRWIKKEQHQQAL